MPIQKYPMALGNHDFGGHRSNSLTRDLDFHHDGSMTVLLDKISI